ncbi:hypothetical protein WAI453_006320 [Rhynchosporium graminicola]
MKLVADQLRGNVQTIDTATYAPFSSIQPNTKHDTSATPSADARPSSVPSREGCLQFPLERALETAIILGVKFTRDERADYATNAITDEGQADVEF